MSFSFNPLPHYPLPLPHYPDAGVPPADRGDHQGAKPVGPEVLPTRRITPDATAQHLSYDMAQQRTTGVV